MRFISGWENRILVATLLLAAWCEATRGDTHGAVELPNASSSAWNPAVTALPPVSVEDRRVTACVFEVGSMPEEAKDSETLQEWKEWKEEVDKKFKAIADKEASAKKSAAKKPSVKLGGRILADWYAYDQSTASMGQLGNQQNGFRFDTVRLHAAGSAFDVVDYYLQLDFAGTQGLGHQSATFKDVFIGVSDLPVLGRLRVGHFKEPFGMDQLTSSKHVTFLERNLTDMFSPARNVGIMAFNHSRDENRTWQIGAFISEAVDEPPIFRDDNGGTAMTMRHTWTPWYAREGRRLLHLGIGYSYRDIADGSVRYRKRPEADLGDYLLDSGNIAATSDVQLLNFEAAWVHGPFRVQSECVKSFVGRAGLPNPEFDGAYVQASYFLTGEQRKYKRNFGTFSDRVVPNENFIRACKDGQLERGKGAWEVSYRASYVDLDSAGILGGNATNHTVGLNWYLNPYTRWMFNYINSDLRRGGISGNMNIFATRFQIDF